jgi:hypothetical protein
VEKKRFITIAFYCILFAAHCAGCGKKGDPTAPRPVVPEAIEDLKAHPQGGSIILRWSTPRENTDGSSLADLKGFKIVRSVRSFEKECKTCPKKFVLLYDMDYKNYLMHNPRATTVEYCDKDLSFENIYTYAVVSYNAAQRHSPQSNIQEVSWNVPPLPPRNLQGGLDGKSAVLFWEEPLNLADGTPLEGLTGYNLYRRLPDEDYPLNPVNQDLITTTACRDKGIKPDSNYFFMVRSARKVKESLIESDLSGEIGLNTTDSTSPAIPTGLVAILTDTGIVLKWDENKEEDLEGYYLYRLVEGEAEAKRLNDEPLTLPSYFDQSVEDGQRYTYRVTAVDSATQENESAPSQEVSIQYIY